jgi:predicted transcriptional regulator
MDYPRGTNDQGDTVSGFHASRRFKVSGFWNFVPLLQFQSLRQSVSMLLFLVLEVLLLLFAEPESHMLVAVFVDAQPSWWRIFLRFF